MKEELINWLDHQCIKSGAILLINGNKDGFTCTMTTRDGKVYMGWSDATVDECVQRCKNRVWIAESAKRIQDINDIQNVNSA